VRCSHAVKDKRLLRASVLAARAARSTEQRADAERRIAVHAADAWSAATTVTGYAAIGTEPPTRLMLDRLQATGAQVLLPVVIGNHLGWGRYARWAALTRGPHGLLQPQPDDDGATAAAAADVVLAPALAVDMAGHRLGRGGGYYDRWLADLSPGSTVVAVVYDDEILDAVPHEPHDMAVTAALTPSGLIPLGS
jgi:5-formyltetrahydrofolate cyclo-ligase